MVRMRRTTIALVSAVLVSALSFGSVAAIAPPTGGASKCKTFQTGYDPIGFYPWLDGGYAYSGDLRLELCVVKDSAGKRAAWAQLSYPVYDPPSNKFTGETWVWLQVCTPGGLYTNVGTAGHFGYGTQTVNTWPAGRIYFPTLKSTLTTAGSAAGYRVHFRSFSAFVAGDSATPTSLSPHGIQVIPQNYADWYTGCMTV